MEVQGLEVVQEVGMVFAKVVLLKPISVKAFFEREPLVLHEVEHLEDLRSLLFDDVYFLLDFVELMQK